MRKLWRTVDKLVSAKDQLGAHPRAHKNQKQKGCLSFHATTKTLSQYIPHYYKQQKPYIPQSKSKATGKKERKEIDHCITLYNKQTKEKTFLKGI